MPEEHCLVAEAFLEAADGDADADTAYRAFTEYQAKLGDTDAMEAMSILDEVMAEELAEQVSEQEVTDWLDEHGVDEEVGAEYLIKAAQLAEAGDAEDVWEAAEEMLEQTRAAESKAIRELKNTRAAGVRGWRVGSTPPCPTTLRPPTCRRSRRRPRSPTRPATGTSVHSARWATSSTAFLTACSTRTTAPAARAPVSGPGSPAAS